MRSWPQTALALGIFTVLVACEDPEPTPEPPPPPVRVASATVTSRNHVVRVTAPIEAERRATLRTEAGGRVVEAPFRAGASVSRGDVIVRLSGPRTAISISEAQARVGQARASLRQVTRAREDAEALARQNANTPNVVETARDREAEARARLEEAEAGLAAARAGVTEASVRAPFDGVLADFRVNVGEYVGSGTEVAVLVDPEGIEAELLLDPVEGSEAQPGDRVTLTLAEHGDRVFEGRVDFVGDVLDPRTRRLPVRVAIDDPDRAIRPGSVAAFEVLVGEPRDVVMLPDGAVQRRLGRTQVFVVEDGVAQARDVEIGEIAGGRAEVLGGLDEGEEVVVDGLERVVPGQDVRVVTDLAAQNEEAP
jgi:membrane fusion protein (multidrug efflux system)